VLTTSTGGIGRHVASLTPRLLDRGHQLKLFCPAATTAAQGFADLQVELLPLRALRQLSGADVVHAHGYKAGGLAAAATERGTPPLVVSWHNAVLGTGASGIAGRLLQAGVARMADLTLAASTDLLAEAVRLGAAEARLGPVAAPTLAPSRADRGELRRNLAVGNADLMVLTVSRLAPQKNLDLVLDIAEAASRSAPVRFFIVGDGPERSRLEHRVASAALPVRFLGSRDDISELMAAADIALLTSNWEARALVAQEALLAGLPLISTRVGGIEELVADAAILVEPGDLSAAVAELLLLADRPERRSSLSRAGLERSRTWPDEDQVADDVLAGYRQAIAASSAGPGVSRLRRLLG
jgi:glycosyltransferase involved in cell wall biosynthesis